VAATIPAKLRARARRDAAAFYLSERARGVLKGELTFVAGDQQTAVATAEFLILEIEFKQKRRATRVEVRLQWPNRPLIKVALPKGDRHGR
jgi:amphi-Trp domain-containing protein